MLRQVVEQRLALMLDFEKINQGLLLIGDWYTAKLYRIIYDEFYLDEWAATIKGKLEEPGIDHSSDPGQLLIFVVDVSWRWCRLPAGCCCCWATFILFYFDIRAVK